jgi:hypothetical protein
LARTPARWRVFSKRWLLSAYLRLRAKEAFGLTPTLELLRTDVAGSLCFTVCFLVGPWAWRAFEQVDHSVRTGESALDHVEYWARNPDVSKMHAMTGLRTR